MSAGNRPQDLGTIYCPSPSGPRPLASLRRLEDGSLLVIPGEVVGPSREAGEGFTIPGAADWKSILPALPTALALEVLARSGAALGRSLLVVGSDPWAGPFLAAGELLSMAPISWMPGRGNHRLETPFQCEIVAGETAEMIDRLKIITGNRGYDLVVETSGDYELFKTALGAGGVGSSVLVLGESPGSAALDLFITIHFKNLKVRGIWEDRPDGMLIIDAFRKGRIGLVVARGIGSTIPCETGYDRRGDHGPPGEGENGFLVKYSRSG